MNNTRFLILEKSYIIRQGIKTILKDIANVKIIEDTNYNLPLDSIIENTNPSIIIFNCKLLKEQASLYKTLKSFEDKIKLVVIKGTNKKLHKNHIFDLSIDIDSSKAEIFKNINLLINEINPLSNEEQTSELSDREIEVLKNVAKGKINKEIADILFISTHTVITHRKNISKKLGIKSVAGLTIYAIINKIIIEDELDEIQ
ncbi:MAG: helix-turn-helix transcriptional regulator [Bacteroidales bacterium]|nr:helix-turn-helix transcriptional regulator [Bacteroidales bacterium]